MYVSQHQTNVAISVHPNPSLGPWVFVEQSGPKILRLVLLGC